jgi:hypothetical protein
MKLASKSCAFIMKNREIQKSCILGGVEIRTNQPIVKLRPLGAKKHKSMPRL